MSFYFLLLMCFFFFPIEWWVSFIPFIPCILISTFSHFFSIELCWGFGPQVLHRPRSFPSLAAGQCNTTTLVCDDEGVGGRRETGGDGGGRREREIDRRELSLYFFSSLFPFDDVYFRFFPRKGKDSQTLPKEIPKKEENIPNFDCWKWKTCCRLWEFPI